MDWSWVYFEDRGWGYLIGIGIFALIWIYILTICKVKIIFDKEEIMWLLIALAVYGLLELYILAAVFEGSLADLVLMNYMIFVIWSFWKYATLSIKDKIKNVRKKWIK